MAVGEEHIVSLRLTTNRRVTKWLGGVLPLLHSQPLQDNLAVTVFETCLLRQQPILARCYLVSLCRHQGSNTIPEGSTPCYNSHSVWSGDCGALFCSSGQVVSGRLHYPPAHGRLLVASQGQLIAGRDQRHQASEGWPDLRRPSGCGE